jgi:uncharacterized protein (TIGR04255 family)
MNVMASQDFPVIETPFGYPVPSVHLAEPPLNLVVAQVRFPPILALDFDAGRERVAEFQDRIRGTYPMVGEGREVGVELAEPDFAPKTTAGVLHRFTSPKHAWQVSLARSFVALQTATYTERSDLVDRLREVLDAVAGTIHPEVCERIGVRYSSRIADPDLLARLPELFRPEILGAALGSDVGDDNVQRVHMVTDSFYALPNAALRARWGRIPPGTTIDANVPPAPTDSFFIDIDVFSTTVTELDSTELVNRAQELCDRQYRYFRWMVTPAYLVAHGGQP